MEELAETLGTTPYELRQVIHTLNLGVGRGSRYQWPSMAHADVKKITAAWETRQQAAVGETHTSGSRPHGRLPLLNGGQRWQHR